MGSAFEETPEERLFKAALAFAEDEREAFVRSSAGDDEGLYQIVIELLDGYEQSGGDVKDDTLIDDAISRQRWGSSTEEPGIIIGPFTLVRQVGEGGMGTVWEAQQSVPIARRVALKLIKLGMDTAEVVQRFERERQTLALMEHPNIAAVHEAGATALGRPYFAMEFVEGKPITDYGAQHELTVDDRLRLMLTVCAGIEHAHRKGVIHRDLKPTNILVSKEGVPKIIDFGIAKAAADDGGTMFTRASQMLGTPAYMSPEQASGVAKAIDTRSDVYSLGVVLYELLAGAPPFDPERLASTGIAELQKIIAEEEPPTPSTRHTRATNSKVSAPQSNLPPPHFEKDLDWIVMKAMAKEPERRYQNAAALGQDLQRYLDGEAVSAAPPTAGYLLGKFARRHRAAVASVIAVVLALALGLIASLILGGRARDSAANEKLAREESQTRLTRMFAMRSFEKGQAGKPRQAALWAAKAAQLAEPASEEYLANITRAEAWTRETPVPWNAFHFPGEIKTITFHPAERHLMIAYPMREKSPTHYGWQIWDISSGSPLEICGKTELRAMAWSPDGSLLAVSPKDGQITILRFPSLTEVARCELQVESKSIAHLAFNRDASVLAATNQRHLEFFSTGDGSDWQPLLASESDAGFFRRIAFSPTDPDCLATASSSNMGRVYKIDRAGRSLRLVTERHHREPPGRSSPMVPPAFDSDGRTVSFNGREKDVESIGFTRVDANTGELLLDLRGKPGLTLGETLCQSDDGKHLILRVRGIETSRLIDAQSGQIVQTDKFQRQVTSAAFDKESQRAIIGSEDGSARILAKPGWNPIASLDGHQRPVSAVAFSPSGRFVATAQDGSLVRIWRIDSPHHGFVATDTRTRAVLSRDGSRFAIAGHSTEWPAPKATRVFHTATGEPAGPPLRCDDLLLDAAFSPDGKVLATAWTRETWQFRSTEPDAGSLRLWDWESGTLIGEPILGLPSAPRSIAWHPTGNTIAIHCAGGQIMDFDAESGTLRLLRRTKKALGLKFRGEIAFSASGQTLAAWSCPERVHLLPSLSGDKPKVHGIRHRGMVSDLSFYGDSLIACVETNTRSSEPRLSILNPKDGEHLIDPLVQPEWMESVAFAPDGRRVLTTGRDGVARLIDWRSGKETCPPIEHERSVRSGAFVPGTPFVLTGTDGGEFRISDSRTGIGIAAFTLQGKGREILEILVTPDGKTALYTSDGIKGIGLVHLGGLHEQPQLDLASLLEISALNAGATLDAEGHLHEIPTDEWLERWQRFRKAFPDHHELRR